MQSWINKYTEFIMNPDPSSWWVFLRFILHWITLPIKLVLIGTLGLIQIIWASLTASKRPVPKMPDLHTKQQYFDHVTSRLPILHTQEYRCYVNRVPFYQEPTGWNHNSDHQCSRHSTYAFLLSRLGIQDDKVDKATWMHMQGHWLARGYGITPYGEEFFVNAAMTSGDMLCGLNMAMMETNNSITRERFDQLITGIIENDYSLLEGAQPPKGDAGHELYAKLLKEASMRPEIVRLKSQRAMWQPGIETVGAQALTVLAALRIADKKLGNRLAKKHYRKLLWKYGYGLLSLFPTAFVSNRRGYFNDHNCLLALYVLSKLSDSKWGRFFWKIPMLYTWALSRHWYNGYFTGLLNDAHPGTVSQKYIDDCIAYLYEDFPRQHSFTGTTTALMKDHLRKLPVPFNEHPEDEFAPDIAMDKFVAKWKPENLVRGGLGFMAHAVMLEKNPRQLLK